VQDIKLPLLKIITMYSKPFRPANKTFFSNFLPIASLVLLALLVGGCESVPDEAETTKPAPLVKTATALDTTPLDKVTSLDIRFAQTALKQLKYKIGTIDGIWGPRSELAIQHFEQSKGVPSANGKLSKANLYALSKATKVRKSDLRKSSVAPSASAPAQPPVEDIASKLDKKIPLQEAPQLILLDKPYPMMEKPNPFSEMVAVLQAGAGVYVISLENGWYEIESLDEQKGYIKEP